MQAQSSSVRLIPLSRGLWTLVDAADYPYLSSFKWWATRGTTGSWYACRTQTIIGTKPKRALKFKMHRVIMNAPQGTDVDHINGDGLDNRRCNLRVVTHAQNMRNSHLRSNNTTGLKGISWDSNRKKWQAGITVQYHRFGLGRYDDAIEAARAYDRAALEHFGPYARLNFPDQLG